MTFPPDTTGSGGYQIGSEGYQPLEGEDASRSPDRAQGGKTDVGDEDAADQPGTGAEPFWRRAGFGSFDEYLAALNEDQRKADPWAWRPSVQEIPPPDLPSSELGDVLEGLQRDAGAPRQVAIRLLPGDYATLREIAEEYGVKPTTLARMLVRRGILALRDRRGRL